MKIVFPGLEKTKVNGGKETLSAGERKFLRIQNLTGVVVVRSTESIIIYSSIIIKMQGLVLFISTHPHSFSDAFYSVRPPPPLAITPF